MVKEIYQNDFKKANREKITAVFMEALVCEWTLCCCEKEEKIRSSTYLNVNTKWWWGLRDQTPEKKNSMITAAPELKEHVKLSFTKRQ